MYYLSSLGSCGHWWTDYRQQQIQIEYFLRRSCISANARIGSLIAYQFYSKNRENNHLASIKISSIFFALKVLIDKLFILNST